MRVTRTYPARSSVIRPSPALERGHLFLGILVKIGLARTGCLMTLFVDDIAISGARANKQLLTQVRHVVRDHGHRTKDKKSLTFAATAVKTVTGVVVTAAEVKRPNRRHHAIRAARQQLSTAPAIDTLLLTKQLAGRIQEARQIL